jgi:hypothetical protein
MAEAPGADLIKIHSVRNLRLFSLSAAIKINIELFFLFLFVFEELILLTCTQWQCLISLELNFVTFANLWLARAYIHMDAGRVSLTSSGKKILEPGYVRIVIALL